MTVHFGPKQAPPKADRIPITFGYLRDDELETQEFKLVDKRLDAGTLEKLSHVAEQNAEQAAKYIPLVTNMIGKMMDNSDGVKAQWTPVKLPPVEGEEPAVPRFRGPDGEIYEWEYVDTFTDPTEGSSRRRWLHLMRADDDAEVDLNDVLKLMQHVISVAAGRPTPASA